MSIAKVHIMQKEQDPLNLKSLPLVSPAEDGWPAVRAALEQHSRRRRVVRYGIGGLAMAASVTFAIGLFLATPTERPAALSGPATVVDAAQPATGSPIQPVDSLIALSQQLESRLRAARADIGALPTEVLIYQVELEDMIALVDEELSQDPDSRALWSHRINLLLDLDQIYQTQLRRDYHRMASL
jgi:hypothetical protein